MKEILNDCWQLYIINVNVVTFDPFNQHRAYMHTYFPFTAEHCAMVKPRIYDLFENGSFKRNISLFPSKVDNFFGCSLTVGTHNYPPYMKLSHMKNGSNHFDGFEGIITRVLSQRLNFSLILKTSDRMWGKFNDGNPDGLKGLVNFLFNFLNVNILLYIYLLFVFFSSTGVKLIFPLEHFPLIFFNLNHSKVPCLTTQAH